MDENKKICKRCKRKRKLGKFGKLLSKKDGKNIYCRDCMIEIRNKYKKTLKGKKSQKKSIEKYKEKNKEKIKEYNKEYYKKNKELIIFNQKSKKQIENILISENLKKTDKKKINKDREIHIEINPKRKTIDE